MKTVFCLVMLSMFLVSNLMAEPNVLPGITKLSDGVIMIDDLDTLAFPLTPPAGTVEKDPSAYGGTFARLNSKFGWGIQVKLPHSIMEKGREYQIEARIRVKPKLPEKDGVAAAVGLYDGTLKRVPGQYSFKVSTVGKDWIDLRVMGFISAVGNDEIIWVGCEGDILEYIDVDWFKLTPQPFPVLDAYHDMLHKKPGALGMFVRAGTSACSGVELVGTGNNLLTDIYIDRLLDPNIGDKAWVGLAVDYYVPGRGYKTRHFYSAGKGWKGTPQMPAAVEEPQDIEHYILPGDLNPGKWTRLSIDLAGNAPAGWDGRIYLRLTAQETKGSDSVGLALIMPETGRFRIIGILCQNSEATWDDYALLDISTGDLKAEMEGNTMGFIASSAEKSLKKQGKELSSFLVRIEPATRLIYRDKSRVEWANSDQAVDGIRLSAARNEYESVQIAVINVSKTNMILSAIEPGDLKLTQGSGKDENMLSKRDIKVSLVDYVYQGDAQTGRWIPDGLPPFRSIEIPAGKYQPIWVTVRVRKGLASGNYTGSIVLKVKEGQNVIVPVEMKVSNITLPDKSHLKTAFWFEAINQAREFYGLKRFKIDDIMPYLDIMAEHRISVSEVWLPKLLRSEADTVEPLLKVYREKDGSFSFDFSNYDKIIAAMAERNMNAVNLNMSAHAYSGWEYFDIIDRETGKIERFHPGASWENRQGWLTQEEMDNVVGAWVSAAWNRYRDKYKDVLYYQGDDEPVEAYGRWEGFITLYSKVGKWVPGLPRLITHGPVEKMAPVVDIWCPLDVFFDPAACTSEQIKGKTVWWYVIGDRLSVGLPPLEARTLAWTTLKYNLSGLLYWSINASWTYDAVLKKKINISSDPSERWPYKPFILPGNPPQDQTGLLIYPGPNGPVSSQRLENLRDGIEEYDLLYQLKEKIKDRRTAGLSSGEWHKSANELVNVPDEIVPDKFHCLTDPARMDYWREKLFMLLETAPELKP